MKKLLSLLLAAAMLLSTAAVAVSETVYYESSAQGFASQVKVKVSLEGGKVVGLEVDDSGETYTTFNIKREDSVEKYIAAVLEAGTYEGVDVKTGATFPCTAVQTVL